MSTLFQDANGLVNIENGWRQVSIDRFKFMSLEPQYSLPGEFIGRRYDGQTHCLFTSDSQQVASDISSSQLDGYIAKVQQYKSLLRDADTPIPLPGNVDDSPNFTKLESLLRGSQAWGKMFVAMGKSTRANAAATLILTAIAATKNQGDLKVGFLELLAAMNEQASVPTFSDSEIAEIKAALVAANFEPKDYFPDDAAQTAET
jgi:hypothetical protein